MNGKKRSIHLILWKYKQGELLSQKDEAALQKWMEASNLHRQLFEELSNDNYWANEMVAFRSRGGDPAWNIIGQRLDDLEYFEGKPPRSNRKLLAAAVIVGCVVAGVVIYARYTSANEKRLNSEFISSISKEEEVFPASDKARLQLGDGSLVALDRTNKKMLGMERFGMFVSVEQGSLIYRTNASTRIEQHTLITPRAAQYQIMLSDGSRVWLNAESSLSYPTTFSADERIVELVGEGYFEVAKNEKKPFKVKVVSKRSNTNGAKEQFEVRVLGTHFNIKAYEGDGRATTTLVEGAVLVKSAYDSVRLHPGEKAIAEAGKDLKVTKADISGAMAWKEKLFWFQDQPIPEIMRQIERWYDVKVIFKGNTSERFTGVLPRNLTLGQILTVLDKGGEYSFEVRDKTVTVFP